MFRVVKEYRYIFFRFYCFKHFIIIRSILFLPYDNTCFIIKSSFLLFDLSLCLNLYRFTLFRSKTLFKSYIASSPKSFESKPVIDFLSISKSFFDSTFNCFYLFFSLILNCFYLFFKVFPKNT